MGAIMSFTLFWDEEVEHYVLQKDGTPVGILTDDPTFSGEVLRCFIERDNLRSIFHGLDLMYSQMESALKEKEKFIC